MTTETLYAHAPQMGFFDDGAPPVMAAWGAGVDSTAMLVELVERGERVDIALFADTGAEKPETYAFIPIFRRWLEERGVRVETVRYQASRFQNWPAYDTLDENCITNATLPSISFGRPGCSQKWKIEPQNRFALTWEPAVTAWRSGGRVIKLIGYDCSPADSKRYAEREGYDDPRYVYRYPLREWGWTRSDCIARIERAGLPVPVKSACYMCAASKPHEIDALPAAQLRRIVLMEARAAPRLKNVEGLWRKSVKGCRGATPRPGSMTQYIREQGLLPAEEIDSIEAAAQASLASFGAADGHKAAWAGVLDLRETGRFDTDGRPLYRMVERDTACAAA